ERGVVEGEDVGAGHEDAARHRQAEARGPVARRRRRVPYFFAVHEDRELLGPVDAAHGVADAYASPSVAELEVDAIRSEDVDAPGAKAQRLGLLAEGEELAGAVLGRPVQHGVGKEGQDGEPERRDDAEEAPALGRQLREALREARARRRLEAAGG